MPRRSPPLLTPGQVIAASGDARSRALTPGQRWKLRRDLVIYLAASRGASVRLLADVFDLPHSRISVIIRNFKSKYQSAHHAKPEEV